jgi:hypothetical protein
MWRSVVYFHVRFLVGMLLLVGEDLGLIPNKPVNVGHPAFGSDLHCASKYVRSADMYARGPFVCIVQHAACNREFINQPEGSCLFAECA